MSPTAAPFRGVRPALLRNIEALGYIGDAGPCCGRSLRGSSFARCCAGGASPHGRAPAATASAGAFRNERTVELHRARERRPAGQRRRRHDPAVKGLSKFALAAAYDGSQDDHDGLSGLVSAQYVRGGLLSAHAIGDVQVADNIEAVGALRLYEAWVSRDYDGARGWKAGLIDLNVDFDTQETGALFLNSADGIGPELGHSGLNGPSIFPTTALGVTGYVRAGKSLTVRIGYLRRHRRQPLSPGCVRGPPVGQGRRSRDRAGRTEVRHRPSTRSRRLDVLGEVRRARPGSTPTAIRCATSDRAAPMLWPKHHC